LKSKYFIAHLLSGGARAYHEKVTRALASQFRIFPLHERVSPHITVKPPFECDEDGIAEVERVLRAFSRSESAEPYTVRGFGRFGFKTIYLNVETKGRATALVRRMLATLNANIPWLPRFPLEGNKLHSSVARFLNRRQYRRILRTLSAERPVFHESFDSVAIMKKEGRAWKVQTVIALSRSENRHEPAHVLEAEAVA
jgi:2'-5' RNA ligase